MSQIRVSQIRATEISSNHRKLHGANFFAGWSLRRLRTKRRTWGRSGSATRWCRMTVRCNTRARGQRLRIKKFWNFIVEERNSVWTGYLNCRHFSSCPGDSGSVRTELPAAGLQFASARELRQQRVRFHRHPCDHPGNIEEGLHLQVHLTITGSKVVGDIHRSWGTGHRNFAREHVWVVFGKWTSDSSSPQCDVRDDAVVLRLYEAYGGRTSATVALDFPAKQVFL